MANFKLPLSGDVPVSVAPWTNLFGSVGDHFSFLNVELGHSSAPEVEKQVLERVGSYGKQLGCMGDVLRILVERLEMDRLSEEERMAIYAFKIMLRDVDEIKSAHGRAPATISPGKDGRRLPAER
jgi:hypothetical protein